MDENLTHPQQTPAKLCIIDMIKIHKNYVEKQV